jgi:hypothetical protein
MGRCANHSPAGCITALAFAASDPTCGTYAFATGDGRLQRTVNAGTTWDDLDANNGVPGRFVTDLAFAPTDANVLYATLSGLDEGTPGQPGHVFKTTNALAAAPLWIDVSPPVDEPINAIAVDPVDSQIVYAGADMGVWKSTDGGGTWTHMGPENGMPNVAVFDLEIHPTVRRPFAFTFGRGAFTLACRSDAECDDQNASNGVETCDLASGRCRAGIAPPTASPTATSSGTPTPTGTATPTVTSAAMATRTASPTVRPTPTATATGTLVATQVPTQTRTAPPTATPTRTVSGNGSGCSIAPPHPTDAAGAVVWILIVPLLWRSLWRRNETEGRPRKRGFIAGQPQATATQLGQGG